MFNCSARDFVEIIFVVFVDKELSSFYDYWSGCYNCFHFFHTPFSATIALSSTNGAFESVVFWNSGSVFQPSPSSLVPDSFSKCPSGALILESFDANSFRSFLESSRICPFSFSVTLCHVKFFVI